MNSIHETAAFHNVSCASGTFATHLRGSSAAEVSFGRTNRVAALHDNRGLRCSALMTYNRRTVGRSSASAMSAGHRAPEVHKLSHGLARFSHAAGTHFNALQRLASQVLSPQGSADSHSTVQAAAQTVAPAAPAKLVQPGIQRNSAFSDGRALPQEPPSTGRPGGVLGYATDFDQQYVLENEIGSGSFGTVYGATAVADSEQVAVKVLPKEPERGRARRGSGRTARDLHRAKIQKEVSVLQKLQHSGNTVPFLGVYEDQCNVYIVMEDCKGGDLEQLLDGGACLTERQAALIMHEVLATVAACHQNGFYHGDVKPANFMLKKPLDPARPLGDLERLQPGTWLKAIDFGCAQPVTPGVPLTRKTGTPIFMAPEVFIGNYGMEADLWAAGMMMYQLLAGRFPYWPSLDTLHTTSLEEVMQAVIQQDAPLDYGVWKEVSPQCLDFMRALLNRDPAQRISASGALQHEWFRHFAIGGGLQHVDRAVSGNIVPLARGMSDALRLRMCGAELSRAASRKPAELSGLLDAVLAHHAEDLRASC